MNPPETPLEWRVEETCTSAWPALREVPLGDWVLRLSPGVSRRANSLNPLNARAGDVDAAIAAARPVLETAGQPALFRVLTPLLDPAVDHRLAALGFTAEGETITLYADGTDMAPLSDPDIRVRPRPDDAWLAAMYAMQERGPAERAVYARIVGSLTVPAAFASLAVDGRIVSAAFAALHDRLLCIESVVTDGAHRGRGLARRMLGGLFAWGEAQGMNGACLQVQADNDPAIRLYHRLGLTAELYRYHYRRAPSA